MPSDVKLYAAEFSIDGKRYAIEVPAKSWEHAQSLVSGMGGTVVGEDVMSVPAMSGERVIEFLEGLALAPLPLPSNAAEQLTAYMMLGAEEHPKGADDC